LAPAGICQIKFLLDNQNKGTHQVGVITNGYNDPLPLTVEYQVRTPGDKIDCAVGLPRVATANITWTGSEYTDCIVESCQLGSSVVDNECLLNTFNMTITQPPVNNGIINGPSSINYGEDATYTFVPQAGYQLVSWGGDCAGTDSQSNCELHNITSSKDIQVTVEAVPYNLAFNYAPYANEAQINHCSPIQVTVKDITGSNLNRNQNSEIQITGNSEIKLYSDASCGSMIDNTSNVYQLTLPAHSSNLTVYAKNIDGNMNAGVKNFNYLLMDSGQVIAANRNWLRAVSCKDALSRGFRKSDDSGTGDGIYEIDPDRSQFPAPFGASCDMTNGGWTVIPIEYTSQPNQRSGGTNYAQSLGFGEPSSGYNSTGEIKVRYLPDATAAELYVYVTGGDGSWNSGSMQLRAITANWAYNTVTWNNRPAVGGTVLQSLAMGGVKWYTFTTGMTSYLSLVKGAPSSYFGVNIPSSTAGDDVNMAGPTYSDPSKRPYTRFK
jgi:hypothetical protein